MILGRPILLLPIAIVVLLAPAALAVPDAGDLPDKQSIEGAARGILEAGSPLHETVDQVANVVDEATGPADGRGGPGDGDGDDGSGADAPGLARGFLDALFGPGGVIALSALGVVALAGAGFLLATRYVDPKEALENPQRAMLYGYIRGNPGVNLKTLSDDFQMKTSTVLWHIRKLEGAELVRSTKANGFRVFYPVEGGIEAKRLGSAVAALTNGNASQILDYITVHPGVQQKGLVNALGINAGTVRWHLRKLKDTGLMAELSQGRSSTYYPTELGIKALRQTLGLSTEAKPVPQFVTEAEMTPQ